MPEERLRQKRDIGLWGVGPPDTRVGWRGPLRPWASAHMAPQSGTAGGAGRHTPQCIRMSSFPGFNTHQPI